MGAGKLNGFRKTRKQILQNRAKILGGNYYK